MVMLGVFDLEFCGHGGDGAVLLYGWETPRGPAPGAGGRGTGLKTGHYNGKRKLAALGG